MPDPFKFSKPRSRYAVVGHPVSHSKSPSIHRAFAKQCTVVMEYEAIQLDLGGFVQGVRNLQAAAFGGANVTLPFKEQARRLADRLSPRATIAGAVNTLKFSDDGDIEGDNTDGAGLVIDLVQNIGISLAGLRLLVVGAGGAVRGILEPLLSAGVAGVTLVNRTHEKAERLAQEFSSHGLVEAHVLEKVGQAPFDLVINGTAASLEGELPALPSTVFAQTTLVYDLAYADQLTPFLSLAKSAGVDRIADGLGMLVEQAAESFTIWHGIRPDTARILADLGGQSRFH